MASPASDHSFDVFLSHNSKDKKAVIALGERLKACGLKVWLDVWELRPGERWQDALEDIIRTTRTVAVLVGKDGLGPWEAIEMHACLNEFASRRLRVIPVLMPGCRKKPELPLLLRDFTWVDLRGGKDKEEKGFELIMWGITGKKPGMAPFPPPPPPPPWMWRIGVIAVIASLSTSVFVQIRNYAYGEPSPTTPSTHLQFKSDEDLHMVKLNGGDVWIGSDPAINGEVSSDEKPRHLVTIKPFCIGRYEVTREQYSTFIVETGYVGEGDWSSPGFFQSDDHPVLNVSLNDVQAYIKWLNGKTGKKPYRLPTEAEWEFAARAGTSWSRYWGDNAKKACDYANFSFEGSGCKDDYPKTAPVGLFKPNGFGLYDMLGNVAEWTCSDYQMPYGGAETQCGTGAERVVRGGSWSDGSMSVRSASRDKYKLGYTENSIGFRLAQDLNDSCKDRAAKP